MSDTASASPAVARFTTDLHRWWAKVRGKPDPLLKIGQEEYSNQNGDYVWALRI